MFAISRFDDTNYLYGRHLRSGRMIDDAHWLPCSQSLCETRSIFGFDGNNLHFGPQALDRQRNSRDQASATDRNQDHVNLRYLIQNFESHCSLAGNYLPIIITVDISEAFASDEIVRKRSCFREILSPN